LVIISHGYPGNRYLLSHMGENLASKGYVVAAIDHTDSTYDDLKDFASTLYNRAFDQSFVISAVQELSAGNGFLNGLVDSENAAVVGYSMGGYGLINNLGGGLSEAAVTRIGAPPNRLLTSRTAADPDYRNALDSRIKAGVAIAPWGMNVGFWDAQGLTGLEKPMLIVAGDADNIAAYKNGARAIFEQAINSDRYLLTYQNAGHNAGAPIPLPVELAATGNTNAADHYLDPVWDTVRMNNILNHFVTAFLDLHLKGESEKRTYLDLISRAQDGVHSLDSNNQPRADHTYWKGFPPGSGIGLRLERGESAS
jgi:predicted dienelactone hydrolase